MHLNQEIWVILDLGSDFDGDIGTSLETQCPSVDISSVIETSMAREQFRDLLSPENKINFWETINLLTRRARDLWH